MAWVSIVSSYKTAVFGRISVSEGFGHFGARGGVRRGRGGLQRCGRGQGGMGRLWGMEGRSGAREGAGARRGVKRRSISKFGKSGRGKSARSARGGMVLLSGAVGVGWALGVAQGVAAWRRWGPECVCGETTVNHLVCRCGVHREGPG